MNTKTLISWGGLATLVGGVGYTLSWWLHPPDESLASILSQNWVPAHMLGMITLILLTLGLVAIYSKVHERVGVLGLVGFLISFVSLIHLSAIYTMALIVEPVLAEHASDLLDPAGPLQTSTLFGLFFLKTILGMVVGLVLFGYTIFQTNLMPKWSGALVALGVLPFALFLTGGEYPFMVFQVAGSAFALGLAWMGYSLWSGRK